MMTLEQIRQRNKAENAAAQRLQAAGYRLEGWDPRTGQRIAALFGFGGLPASGVESLYYLRSYAVVLVIALLGATPLPAKAVQRLRDTSAGSAVLSVAEPVALVLLLALCTAYLVDGSFNPFLYFRF